MKLGDISLVRLDERKVLGAPGKSTTWVTLPLKRGYESGQMVEFYGIAGQPDDVMVIRMKPDPEGEG